MRRVNFKQTDPEIHNKRRKPISYKITKRKNKIHFDEGYIGENHIGVVKYGWRFNREYLINCMK